MGDVIGNYMILVAINAAFLAVIFDLSMLTYKKLACKEKD